MGVGLLALARVTRHFALYTALLTSHIPLKIPSPYFPDLAALIDSLTGEGGARARTPNTGHRHGHEHSNKRRGEEAPRTLQVDMNNELRFLKKRPHPVSDSLYSLELSRTRLESLA